jgi:uncharacterized protein (DUF736 family)
VQQQAQYPVAEQQSQQQSNKMPVDKRQQQSHESYLRTLQYVKSCQNWSAGGTAAAARGPDYPDHRLQAGGKEVGGAKPKTTNGRSSEAQAMMPPPSAPITMPPQQQAGHLHNGHVQNGLTNLGSGIMAVPQQQQSSSKDNMIIGNMNSSMNQLMDENRYLQMMQ